MLDVEGKELNVGDNVVFCPYDSRKLLIGIISKINEVKPTIMINKRKYIISPKRIYKIN